MPNEPIIQPIRLKGVISAGLDFIPIVGNAKALVEAAIGRDPITGRKLESWERGASAAAILGGPLVKGVKHGAKLGAKAISGATSSSKAKTKTVNLADSPTPKNPTKQQAPSLAKKEASATTAPPAKSKEQGNRTDEAVKKKPYSKSRPSYGKEQVEQVWENAKDPIDGKVYDPTGVEIRRNGQWDMGHIPGEKYSEVHELFMNDTITKKEFLEWYRNPSNYRPELPSTNRSHKYE
ncbi:GH-E family nuclease [Solibacillus sp. FSL R7-0682]|uniref:GH-E family nuclease n=1 Tax=Solibacillus sp. FSL R7-0682 TaxID=2921690 RepID=UPI0030F6C852